MIDWVSAFLPLVHPPLNAGSVLCVNPDGTIEWESPRKLHVEGSWVSSMMVKSEGSASKLHTDGTVEQLAQYLYISGNPSKFLQGHNIVGSPDLLALVLDAFGELCKRLNLHPTDFERQQVKRGEYRLTRIDYNLLFSLPSLADTRGWIRAAEYKSKSRHGRPVNKGGTLIFGDGSSYWKIVCYSKFDEFHVKRGRKNNPVEKELAQIPELQTWLPNQLRVELRLFSRKLQDEGLEEAKTLTPQKLGELYSSYIGGLEMSENIELNSEERLKLPNCLRGTYSLWEKGHDLKSDLSGPTYRRHRKLLREYGIDIAMRCDRSPDTSNVVPLIRVLEAKPSSIPAFFFERGLIHRTATANY